MPGARKALTALTIVIALPAQTPSPSVPPNLRPPAAQTVLLKALGRGKQIYVCRADPAGGAKYAWALERPDADLLDAQGKVIGKHYAGPTWESTDGSKVVGEVEARQPAPGAGAVPWLLLKAKSHDGAGIFAAVTYVQRLYTVGGAAPEGGCDQSRAGRHVAIDYHADYYFYGRR